MDAPRVNITICGDGGTGKSSITLRLVRSQWTHEYDPTIEDSYSLTREVDGRAYLLSLTDTAGQEEYRALQSSYAKQADAFLLVYDITNPESLHAQLPYFLDMIGMEADAREDAGRVAPVVIVAGNKCDLNQERRVSAGEGLRWARERGCGFMETSARECVNVEETFALLVRRVAEARRAHELGSAPQQQQQQQKTEKQSKREGGKQKSGHAHGDSFARTEPLSPEGGGSGGEKQGGTHSQGGGFAPWMRKAFCCGR